MASEVDICNLALGHLGDTATVSSINPPEGSIQAEHCQRFYYPARDALLEMHSWGFATKRVTLALLSTTWTEWQYAYAVPSDAINLIAVMPPDATSDYSVGINYMFSQTGLPMVAGGIYQPQPYSWEIQADGSQIIYTNQENAVLRYTAQITDTTQFSPLFVISLTYLLASYLAGPVIKGEVGAAEAKRCLQLFQATFGRATTSDANQRRNTISQNVGWISGR